MSNIGNIEVFLHNVEVYFRTSQYRLKHTKTLDSPDRRARNSKMILKLDVVLVDPHPKSKK